MHIGAYHVEHGYAEVAIRQLSDIANPPLVAFEHDESTHAKSPQSDVTVGLSPAERERGEHD
jgi:hypothetical protein